ncbi:hypothetical protein [Alcanivorax sp.]|uniref:hypothetical protein n=1 Tax=Alcanivorax sp. TaxID=1872427 RepID=UPI0025C18F41|nr:hypothetical protein [Alcanivorax sp.]
MKEVFQGHALINLGLLADFHNHVNALLEEAKSTIEEIENNSTYWLHVYNHDFKYRLRESVFLMVFGHLEEMLLLLRQNDMPQPQSNSLIKKFSPVFIKAFGEKALQRKDICHIKSALLIRNTLLHSSGRPDMMRNEQNILSVIDKHPDHYSIRNQRIIITASGLNSLIKATENLVKDLSSKLFQE